MGTACNFIVVAKDRKKGHERNMSMTGCDLIHCNWAVGMIDLLGQKDAMKTIGFAHSDMSREELQAFNEGVRTVYHAAQLLHETIEHWIDLSGKRVCSSYEAVEMKTTVAHRLKVQRFSDGLVVYTSLAGPLTHCPFLPLYYLIGGCAHAMLVMLANETPIRGGLALGAGCEFRDGELYGQALAMAHELESKVAGYPRIVVDPELYEWLCHIRYATGEGERKKFDQDLTGLCLKMIRQDKDGHAIVDFLSPVIFEQMGLPQNMELISKAKAYVDKKYAEFRRDKNSELAFRYANLLDYFEYRQSSESDSRLTPD